MSFLFDENLPRAYTRALKAMGKPVEHVLDHLPHGASDAEWMKLVASQGWCFVTQDTKTRTRAGERDVLVQQRVCGVYLKTGTLTAWETFRQLVWRWEELELKCSTLPRPFLLELHPKSGIKVLRQPIKGR